jgi:hypothetical protein
MKGKITLLVGGAVGYVLGTRAGRERYEQIKSQAQGIWNNPKVQEKAGAATDFAKEKAPILKDTASGSSASSSSSPSSDTASDFTVSSSSPGEFGTVTGVGGEFEESPYPSSTTTTGLS